jgi:hypothetical protein
MHLANWIIPVDRAAEDGNATAIVSIYPIRDVLDGFGTPYHGPGAPTWPSWRKAWPTMIFRPYRWYIVGAVTFIVWTVLVFLALERVAALAQTH